MNTNTIDTIKTLSFNNMQNYCSKWDIIDKQFIDQVKNLFDVEYNALLANKLYNYIFYFYVKNKLNNKVIDNCIVYNGKNEEYIFKYKIINNKLIINKIRKSKNGF